ncbi:MAG: OprD family outer membrane porin [Sulfuriferula sp.]
MIQKKSVSILALSLAMLAPSMVRADDSFVQWLESGHVSGDLRFYDFGRDFAGTASNAPAGSPYTGKNILNFKDMNAISLGGKLKWETADLDGFSAAAALYFADDVGFNNYTYNPSKLYAANYNYPYLNPLLMGVNRTVDTLGEAYLQYKNPWLLSKIGNQTIDNPWVNSSDGFMIPNLYRAVTATVTPMTGLQVEGDRVLRYKNRTVTDFQAYNISALPYDKIVYNGQDSGTADIGASYKDNRYMAQAWLYHFYGFADMTYLEGGYKLPVANLSPFLNLQYVHETGNGDIGTVDAAVYGAKLGVNLPQDWGSVYIAYNRAANNNVQSSTGSVSDGNLFSPYTQIYNTDPLYTTVMNYGLVSARAAGYAWLVGATLHPLGQALDITPTVSNYYTAPYVANGRAYMLDIAYHLNGVFKGLTIRNRLGIEHDIPLLGSAYVDYRFMLQYTF